MQSRGASPILPLTSVRFFAAFYVVLLHSAMWTKRIDTGSAEIGVLIEHEVAIGRNDGSDWYPIFQEIGSAVAEKI